LPLHCSELCHGLTTNSMEQSLSWEANSFSASQEIPHILWNPKVYYHNHKRLPTVPVPHQINPVCACPSHVLKIHFIIILPYVEIKCQLDATEVFIADPVACSTCFGHNYAHHQELKSIIQWLLPVVFGAVIFKLLVWCGAEGYVSGLQDAAEATTV